MSKKIKLRYECYKCDERFGSWQARNRHAEEAHKPPKKTERGFIRTGEYHRLNGGVRLDVGSKVTLIKVGIVEKIILTEGSDVAEVHLSLIKDVWE